MQQIERVGVVALLFLLVTIVTVALWDDGGEPDTVAAAGEELESVVPSRTPVSEPGDRDGDAGLRSVRARDRERATVPLSGGTDELSPYRGRPSSSPRDPRDSAESVPAFRDTGLRLERPAPRVAADAGDDREGELARHGFRQEARRPSADRPLPEAVALAPATRPEAPRERLAVPATTAATGGPGGGTYVVRSGDTLEAIALRALGDRGRWREIQRLNGDLDPRRLHVGQKLALPAGAARGPEVVAAVELPRATTPPATPVSGPPPGGGVYLVQKGDVLGTIAQKTLGSSKRWKEIQDLNPGLDPRKLHVGARLKLPAGASPAPAPPERQLVADAGRPAPERGEFVVR